MMSYLRSFFHTTISVRSVCVSFFTRFASDAKLCSINIVSTVLELIYYLKSCKVINYYYRWFSLSSLCQWRSCYFLQQPDLYGIFWWRQAHYRFATVKVLLGEEEPCTVAFPVWRWRWSSKINHLWTGGPFTFLHTEWCETRKSKN